VRRNSSRRTIWCGWSAKLADRIQELADRERRSFAREAQVLLEKALKRQKQPEPATQEAVV
jgi:hypothetical protein